MAETLGRPRSDEAFVLLRASKPAEVVTLYEREMSRDEKRSPQSRLAYAIGLMLTGREASGSRQVDGEVLALPNAKGDLRRYAVTPMIADGRLESAVHVLDRILAAHPGSVEDRRLRGSLLGRLRRWDAAIDDTRQVAEALPDDLSAQRAFVQTMLQGGMADEAGELAASLGARAAQDARLANIALLALNRSGRTDEAAALALRMSDAEIRDEATAAAIVRTLVETGNEAAAIETGERLIEEGWEHEILRSNLAHAYLSSHRDDRYERAIDHLREGLDVDPGDVRMNMAMGEALLRSRQYEAAIPFLQKACELQPKAAHQRALFARALKQVGRYEDAAREFEILLDLQPSSPRWARYAAGALSQAGKRRDAAALFEKFVGARRTALPRNFEKGLDALWGRVESVDLPKARLDWAWQLNATGANDRAEWERRAKWGHLADHYLLDWLECRSDRVHDAMMRLADLGDAERVLGGIDRSNGMIIASAHIGPMYAGPLALELLGVRSRWLASTPSVARTAYSKSLISTSEQDDMEVGKAFMRSLRQGYSVVIAVDGAINLAAPRVPFEGQEMTYSSFAARTAHRLGVPSVFAAPRWEGDRIGFAIEQLPDPTEDESADDYAERWKASFFTALRNYLGGEPENLRLSGGLWRHIR